MKIKRNPLLWILGFSCSAFLFGACNKNADSFSSEDLDISNNESSQESTTSELDDLTTSILESNPECGPPPGGRTQLLDDRLACDGITIITSELNAEKTAGKIVVTFGPDGCTDKKGNIRRGSIIITWTGGKWFNVGSSIKTTLDGYSINDVSIEGSRTTTCKYFTASPLSVTWLITASHTATWSDGTTATRTINKIRKWEHSPTEDKFTITNGPTATNSAEGTNRRGRAYKVYITSPLIYLGSCARSSKVFIPIKGEKVISSISSTGKTKSLTINYGNGVCDNAYTVTSGAVVRTLYATND